MFRRVPPLLCGLLTMSLLPSVPAGAKPPRAGQTSARPEAPVRWQMFTSRSGRFSLRVPDDPKKVAYRPQPASGGTPAIHFFFLQTRVGGRPVAFSLSYFDNTALPGKLNERDVSLLLEESWKAYYGRYKDRTIYKRRIRHDGHPALEHQHWMPSPDGKKVYMTGRYVLVGRRMYHPFIAVTEAHHRAGLAGKYVSSLRILR